MASNPESAAAAVETLRAELDMVDGALDSIDRKAVLLPAVLGAIAGIFIAPDQAFSSGQQVLLVAAIGTGVVSVLIALRVMWARDLNLGPNAQQTAEGTHLVPADFNRAVAGSLAKSVDALSELAKWKGKRLNVAFALAAVTILLLALARVAGGIDVTDEQQQPAPTPEASPAAQQPAEQPAPQVERPTDFGQQIAAKGGLPPDLDRRIREIEEKG